MEPFLQTNIAVSLRADYTCLKEWTSDKSRCKSGGIPTSEIKYKTRLELALEMITYQKQKGTRFHWIGGDGLYGHDSKFRSSIDSMGLLYMLDIHSTDGVYIEKPTISIPSKQSKRGRKPTLPKADKTRIKACDIAKELTQEDWKTYAVRDTAKGPLVIDV